MEYSSLSVRILQAGARPVNVPEPVVLYRVGSTAFKSRGGIELLRSELLLQREFHRLGFTSLGEYMRNVIIRGGYRLIPGWCRRALYRPGAAPSAQGSEPEPENSAAFAPPAWGRGGASDDAGTPAPA